MRRTIDKKSIFRHFFSSSLFMIRFGNPWIQLLKLSRYLKHLIKCLLSFSVVSIQFWFVAIAWSILILILSFSFSLSLFILKCFLFSGRFHCLLYLWNEPSSISVSGFSTTYPDWMFSLWVSVCERFISHSVGQSFIKTSHKIPIHKQTPAHTFFNWFGVFCCSFVHIMAPEMSVLPSSCAI